MGSLQVLLFLVALGNTVLAQRLNAVNLPQRNNSKPNTTTTSPDGSIASSPAPQTTPVSRLQASSLAPQTQSEPIRDSDLAFLFAEDIAPSGPTQTVNGTQPAKPTDSIKEPTGQFGANNGSLGDLPADFEGPLPGWAASDTFGNGNQGFPPMFGNQNFMPMPMPMFAMNGSSNDSMPPFPSQEFSFPSQQFPSSFGSQSGFPGPMGPWSNGQMPVSSDMIAQMPPWLNGNGPMSESNGLMSQMPPSPFDPSQRPPFMGPPQGPQQPSRSNEEKISFAILRQILKGGHVKVKLETKTNLVFEQSSESDEHKKDQGGPQPQWGVMNMATLRPFPQQTQVGEAPMFSQSQQFPAPAQSQDDVPVPMGMMSSQSDAGSMPTIPPPSSDMIVPKHLQAPGISNDIGRK